MEGRPTRAMALPTAPASAPAPAPTSSAPRPRHCAPAVYMVVAITPPVKTTVPTEYTPSRMLVATTRVTTLRRALPPLPSVIAEGKALGDTTPLADPAVVAKLKEEYQEDNS